MEKTKINIGSGHRPLATTDNEWEDLDIRADLNPTIVADARHIPRPDGYYNAVYAHSILEHFGKREINDCIQEWTRILKIGGTIEISVPNMLIIAEDIIATKEPNRHNLINLIYGEQDYPQNVHKWGFTPESLKALLSKYGISQFIIKAPERYLHELFITGVKQ